MISHRSTYSTYCSMALIFVGCSIYNDNLIDQAEGVSSSNVDDDGGDGDLGDGDESPGDGDDTSTGGSVDGAGGTDDGSGGTPDGTGGDTGGTVSGVGGEGASGSDGGTGGDVSGVGGTPVQGACQAPEGIVTDLVDDMQLASNRIIIAGGRMGDWISFHGADMLTTPSPNDNGRWPASPMTSRPDDSENFALHYLTELAVEEPDAGEIWHHFGFLLNEGQVYDLSAYDGLLFCGRRDVSGVLSLNMRLITYADEELETQEILETTGGIIPEEWGVVLIPFDEQWSSSNLEKTTNLEFVGNPGVEYDIWIDDIALYTEE